MPFCANCGAEVQGQFCASCGQRVDAPAAGAVAPQAGGLTDNVAGLLCYILGLITGIIFLVLAPYNQNKFIRFHAFQSIFLNIAWVAVVIVESILSGIAASVSWGLLGAMGVVWTLVSLGFLAIWILVMVKAYQGQKFKLPVIGDLAEKQA